MKKLFAVCLFFVCAFCAKAQEQELYIIKENVKTENIDLGGKASIVFVAKTDELVIEATNVNDHTPPTIKKNANGQFEYIFLIDVTKNNERKFSIQRSTYKTELTKKGLKPNVRLTWEVEGPAAWENMEKFLKLVEQSTGKDVHLVQNEACIRFITEVEDLEITPDKHLKFKKEVSKSATGAKIVDIIIDTKTLGALKAKNGKDYQAILANTITIKGDGTNELHVPTDQIENLVSAAMIPYAIEPAIRTVFKEKTFDELLAIARKFYNERSGHTESSYYNAARIAYENALKHTDCPQGILSQLQAEQGKILDLRKFTFYKEHCDSLVSVYTQQEGYNSDNVYKYLGGAHQFAEKLANENPDIPGFVTLCDEALTRMQQHPNYDGPKHDGSSTQRPKKVSGHVSFAKEYLKRPFNTLSVYGTSFNGKVKDVPEGKSKMVGQVKSDGSFSVVLPEGMEYIYIGGENKKTHRVYGNTLDIEIE